jgi:hypothetical protein
VTWKCSHQSWIHFSESYLYKLVTNKSGLQFTCYLDLQLHLHPTVEPGPQLRQVEPIPTHADTVPKVLAVRGGVKRVFQLEDEAWAAHVRRYTMQGNLFSLLQAENKSITWKLYMWVLPRGVLKFVVNSSIDMLPTFTNLRRRGKGASVNCQLCGNMVKQTLFHDLDHCKHTLDQGRLTWRHDSLLNHIVGCLKSALVGKSTVELYCDLDGLQAPGWRVDPGRRHGVGTETGPCHP